MSLITVQEYRDITRDVDTPASQISALIEESTGLVEEYLQRRLRFGTYTDEQLEMWDGGYVYPLTTPVVSVPTDAKYTIDLGGTRLRGVLSDWTTDDWLFFSGDESSSLLWFSGIRPVYGKATYDGGYTETTCPQTLKRAIARGARALVVMNPQRLVGATQITVGDVSVSYPAFSGDLEMLVPGVSLALKPYKRKRIRY